MRAPSPVTDVLACGEAELGLLARSEQEVGEERHAAVLRVEPRDPRALRLVEHIARAENRLRLALHLEHGGSVHDAADHWAVVHVQAGRVPGDYPDPPHLDSVRVLGLRQARVEQHVPGDGLLLTGTGGHGPPSAASSSSGPDSTDPHRPDPARTRPAPGLRPARTRPAPGTHPACARHGSGTRPARARGDPAGPRNIGSPAIVLAA